MKKYHLYLWIIALVGLMTACSQDEAAGPQNKASTRVRIGTSINQALQTRAASVNIPENHQLRYVLEVWSTTESPACIHRDEETATTADAVVFDFTLSESGNYKALLWADFVPTGASETPVNSPNTYTHYADHYYKTNSAEGLKAVELAKTRTNYVINDEARDAFFACITIEKGTGAFEKSVELTRPFGQINVIEKSTDLLAKVATMTLEYNVPIGFNVETGLPLSNYAAAKPTVSTLPTATDARKANLFYDFIFTYPTSQTTPGEIKLKFTSNDPAVTLDDFTIPANMPAVRNKRTNISGSILHTSNVPSNDAKLSVTVSDGWTESDKEEDIDRFILIKEILDNVRTSGNSDDAKDYYYTISTLEQLEALSTLAKAEAVITGCTTAKYRYANYKLDNDISLAGKSWTPIAGLVGTFDGQGHTITNMKVSIQSQSDINGGFFGIIGGTVSNLIVEGEVTVNGERACSAGGICGILIGKIEFCRFNGTVSSTTTNNIMQNYAGGIMGDFGGTPTITGCIANATVTISGGNIDYSGAGGLAGSINGKDCSYSAWNNASSGGTSDMIGKNYNNSASTECKSFTTISELNNQLSDINSSVSESTYVWQAGGGGNTYPKLVKRTPAGN